MMQLLQKTLLVSLVTVGVSGCAARTTKNLFRGETVGLFSPFNEVTAPVDQLQAIELSEEQAFEPLSLQTPEKKAWLISPTEAVQIAVERSKVLQDLGGSSLRNVNGVATIHEPSIQSTDPRLGIEAALAAFDAQLNSKSFVSKNDFPVNNRLLGGGDESAPARPHHISK